MNRASLTKPIAEENRTRIRKLENQINLLTNYIINLPKKDVEKEYKSYISDEIYNENKKELEDNYFGKYIAIDNEDRKIVGYGDSILEAYEIAYKNTGKEKFSFKRVGYIDKL